jgi:hypothetical protein
MKRAGWRSRATGSSSSLVIISFAHLFLVLQRSCVLLSLASSISSFFASPWTFRHSCSSTCFLPFLLLAVRINDDHLARHQTTSRCSATPANSPFSRLFLISRRQCTPTQTSSYSARTQGACPNGVCHRHRVQATFVAVRRAFASFSTRGGGVGLRMFNEGS